MVFVFLASSHFFVQNFLDALELSIERIQLLVDLSGVDQRLDLAVQLEPLPCAQTAPGLDVALDDKETDLLLLATLLVRLKYITLTNIKFEMVQ